MLSGSRPTRARGLKPQGLGCARVRRRRASRGRVCGATVDCQSLDTGDFDTPIPECDAELDNGSTLATVARGCRVDMSERSTIDVQVDTLRSDERPRLGRGRGRSQRGQQRLRGHPRRASGPRAVTQLVLQPGDVDRRRRLPPDLAAVAPVCLQLPMPLRSVGG